MILWFYNSINWSYCQMTKYLYCKYRKSDFTCKINMLQEKGKCYLQNTEREIHYQIEDPFMRIYFSIGCTVNYSVESRTKQVSETNDELNSLCGGRKRFCRFHRLRTCFAYFFRLEHWTDWKIPHCILDMFTDCIKKWEHKWRFRVDAFAKVNEPSPKLVNTKG